MKLWLALARALALLWAGFWLFFFIAESWAWHSPLRVALPWVGVGLLFTALALLPWRWEATGGVLLVAAGVSAGIAYTIWPPTRLPVPVRILTTAVFGAPAIAAGILFLLHHRAVVAGAGLRDLH
jgi:hypothetical protein